MSADRDLLSARLKALAFSPALPIAWDNVTFAPVSGTWLEARLFRGTPERLTINAGGRHRRPGIFQVSVMSELGDGAAPELIAEAIQAHFPSDLRLGWSLRITRLPAIAGGLRDGAWWRVPVSIPFETIS